MDLVFHQIGLSSVYHALPCHNTTDCLKRIKKEINSTNEILTRHTCLLKCIPGDYLMNLVERMPRVCTAGIKAKGGYFEEYKIYFDMFNTFGYYMTPYVLVHNFDVFTIILQCRI
jgi:hypothetical protein